MKALETLVQKLAKIKELFQQKSPNNWNVDSDIFDWFNHDEVNAEPNIDFAPSVETLGEVTTEVEMLNHERSVKLPLLQALDVVIDLVENNKVPANGYLTLIFLSTKRKSGAACKLVVWRDAGGWLRLHVDVVASGRQWGAEDRVLRKV